MNKTLKQRILTGLINKQRLFIILTAIVIQSKSDINISYLFRLMDCEKITKNTFFKCIFTQTFRISTSFFGKMKHNINISFRSYLFPMCLLRKAISFFSYSSMSYYDSLKGLRLLQNKFIFHRLVSTIQRRNPFNESKYNIEE